MSSSNEPSDWRANVAVEEAQEIKQKTRLIEVLEAMHKVVLKQDEALDRYALGEISRDARNVMVLTAVKRAIEECYNLLLRHYRDTNNGEYWFGRDGEPLGHIPMEHEDPVVFWGLRDILHANEFYTESWTERVKHRNMPTETVTRTREYSVPESASMAGYLRLKEFLDAEHAMDIDFKQLGGGEDAGFDYSDILQEGPPGAPGNGEVAE